jgi:hypothetical protein
MGKLKQNHENPLSPIIIIIIIIILLGNIMALLFMASGNKIMKNHQRTL